MQTEGTLVVTISTIEDDIFIVLKDTGKGLPEDEISDIIEDKKREYEDALDEYEQSLIDAVGNIE